ncbi:sugar transferase [Patescibacteria group bacterium]|nr:sugar transferase [Patescibacteria group bacterium]MBU0777216.1 sugar transferase [Patescibacteria group bacterium]MBU0845911.1 sugar transferase [Patescibacteria group bacterium]MBU0922938.1 sugar transferase [Patescibacteria group bacterium]MBU1066215.1 sugar transferase [Patescibacteria group bacterium]
MIYKILKRSIDIVGAIFLLIFFSPVILITALLIKLTTHGPIFANTPKRVGKSNRAFFPYKFRSMIVNAHELLKTDPRFKNLHKEYTKSGYKLYNDPRVTPVGRFIRKHSIDEIPQLLNVLKGEMSIVGPRPYYPEELGQQFRKFPEKKKLLKNVLSVKPGITGYWQVSGRSSVDFDKRIELDAYYAGKKSLFLDLLILLKTPWAMISGKNTV